MSEIFVPRLARLCETIETPRLIIHPIRPADVPDYIEGMKRVWADMHRWVSWATEPRDELLKSEEARMPEKLEDFRQRRSFYMMARDKETQQAVSFVTLYKVEEDARRMGAGYWSPCPGKGYTFEAMAGLLSWGFNQVGAREFYAECPEGHIASERILQRLGFVFERRADPEQMADGRMCEWDFYKLDDPSRLPDLAVTYK